MYPWNAPKIVTFPATTSNTMPFVGSSATPTTNQAPVYRADGRTRNIFEGDTHSINAIHSLSDGPEFENEQEDLAKQPIRSTHSSTQADIPESAVNRSKGSRAVSSPRTNAVRSPIKLPATVSLQIYQHLPATRQRILFYHKNDPYYGFTNFSPHPVIYKGKEYPTSEHLYQFFKV